ncbi:MAG: TerC family protein [Bdellovibrionales bacterium]
MIELFSQPETWATLVILTALEIVLSIDNLVFIAILSNKLPAHQQKKARRLGLLMAVGFRIALLTTAAWLVRMSEPFMFIAGYGFSVRDVVLILGGLFLIWKSTMEIRERITVDIHVKAVTENTKTKFMAVITQIVIIDMVFSIDSIITAVGLAQDLPVMIIAVLIAVATMILASEPLAKFIGNNPTIVMLALAFLIMIGMALMAEGFGHEIPKAFLYVAMAFSLGVEVLNMMQRKAEARRHSKG